MRRSGFIALGVLLPVAVGSAFLAYRWTQRGPGHASVGGAIDRFRTSSTVAAPPRTLVPAPGVYIYDGQGSESLSFLATKQSQGPTEPGTVTRGADGCWTFRMDFNSFHDQTWNRCSAKGRLVESGGTTEQKFDFVSFKVGEHSRVVCEPAFVIADPNAEPAKSWKVHCSGRSDTTNTTFEQDGTATNVGRVTLDVGGVAVPAMHTREDLTLTGGQSGEVHIDIWFAVENGLPLQESHTIRVVSPAPAPLNHVTYSEQGGWHLTSMTPRT